MTTVTSSPGLNECSNIACQFSAMVKMPEQHVLHEVYIYNVIAKCFVFYNLCIVLGFLDVH
jgi:hypothetical protein